MKTSECFCADTAALPPDPRKHVNYTQGMVLGVDDLVQDFAYHRHQRQWLARDAIGYGTLSGLQVAAEDVPGKGLQITVTPGTALSPRGHLLRVAPKQCAAINAWLALEETKSALAELAVPGTPRVHVALCFRDCAVDPLPVPGEPCRCEDQTTAASRTLDDFELKLRLDPPPRQREEETLREFVKWLRRVHGTGATNDAAGRTKVLEWIRKMARDAADNSTKSDADRLPLTGFLPALVDPPPAPDGDEEARCAFVREALRLWVTELRPLWQARWAEPVGGGCGCHEEQPPSADAEECLFLATLTLTLNANGEVDGLDKIAVDQSARPWVLHLRMLQEMFLGGCGHGEVDPGAVGAKGPDGDKGPVGDKGLTGDKGPAGDAGSAGENGAAGDKGSNGDQGAAGEKGPTGDPGAVGDKGPTGDKGSEGDKGPTGDAGPAGEKGADGDKGLTGDKGATGDPGATGSDGDKGAAGVNGPTGDKGPAGDAGPVGDKGAVGDKGVTGDKGQTGDAGAKGAVGDKGQPGDQGPPGPSGPLDQKSDVVRLTKLSLFGSPTATRFSDVIGLTGLTKNVSVSLAVESMVPPLDTDGGPLNVALTVHLSGSNRFRVVATNLSTQIAIDDLVVRWSIIKAR